MYSAVGSLMDRDQSSWVSIALGDSGFALYGPYEEFEPGDYLVKFTIRLPDHATPPQVEQLCCTLDAVSSPDAGVSEATNVFSSYLFGGKTEYTLPFKVKTKTKMEFRASVTGFCPLQISCDRPVVKRAAGDGYDFSPVCASPTPAAPEFFARNLAALRQLYEQGINIVPVGDEVYAVSAGIRIRLQHREEIQVLREVLIAREYNFVSNKDILVIDIGMNSGITTLFLASRAYVKEVHSFEPFSVPLGRARFNIAQNPEFGQKVTVYPFGLSDKDGSLRVLVDSDTTIGTSLAGLSQGHEETISIRGASAVLGPLLDHAKNLGLGVYLKIDCEGAEFNILRSLRADGLLKKVWAIAVEWHKWQDRKATQNDLFAELFEENFLVFDQTQVANPHAGMFYAIRGGH